MFSNFWKRRDIKNKLSPAQITAWIESLSQFDASECVQQIEEALCQVTNSALNNQERYAVLNTLSTPIRYVEERLLVDAEQKKQAFHQKNKLVAQQLRRIHQCHAMAYGMIYNDTSSESDLSRQTNLAAIYRAMACLGDLLCGMHALYAPVPRNVWRQIHLIYMSARQQGEHLSRVNDASPTYENLATVENLYKTLLLLSLSNTHQLAVEEILSLRNAISRWADYAQLQTPDFAEPAGYCHFVICTGSDTPPVALPLEKQPAVNILHLCTNELLQKLDFYLRYASDNNDPSILNGLSHTTVSHLLDAWQPQEEKRQYNVARKKQPISVSIGLGIGGSYDLLYKIRSTKSPQATNLSLAAQAYGTESVTTDTSSSADHKTGKNLNKNDTNDLMTLTKNYVMNKNHNGFCLLYEVDVNASIEIGQLITVHYTWSMVPFSALCEVRWKKHINQFLLLGLKVISRKPMPGLLHTATGEQQVLLLPAEESSQFPRLITPPELEHGNDDYTLQSRQGKTKIKLANTLLKTNEFRIVSYEVEA